MQGAASPLDVTLVVAKKSPEGIAGERAGNFFEVEDFAHHE